MKKLFTILFLLWASVAHGQTITSITYYTDRHPTCTQASPCPITPIPSPPATAWTSPAITLLPGINHVTITVTNSNAATVTASRTITYAPFFPGNTLAGSWGFNEGSGTTVLDSSGNVPANDGTLLNGAALTNAVHVHDKGVSLTSIPGNPQYVNVPDANSLDFTQSFTWSGWVTLPSPPSTLYQAFFAKNASYLNPAISGWPVQFLYATGSSQTSIDSACTSGSLQAGFVANGGAFGVSDLNLICSTPLPTNTPIFVAVTYDGPGSLLKLYRGDVPGLLAATKAASGYMEPTTEALQIGSDNSDEGLTAVISSPRVYNYALALSVGKQNVTFGAACDYTDATPSIIQNANCGIIQPQPPVDIKIPAAPDALKIGAGAVVRFGARP